MALTSKLETILSFSMLNACVADPLTSSKTIKWKSQNLKHSPEETEINISFFFKLFYITRFPLLFTTVRCTIKVSNYWQKSFSPKTRKFIFFVFNIFFIGWVFSYFFLQLFNLFKRTWVEKSLCKKKINKNGWIDAETISSQKESLSSTELWTTSF